MDGDFWIWTAVIGGVFAIGVGAIATTSLNPLGSRIPFKTAVSSLSIPIQTAALTAFETGIQAFQAGKYDQAIDAFNQVTAQEPNCAEALHNRALAQANLGKLNLALPDFLKANDLYDQQGTKSGVDAVKQALETLSQ
ncbi:MAG: tetratricopeptide repeat protein [Cyanobacteria bacterium P01_A01_bin.105]